MRTTHETTTTEDSIVPILTPKQIKSVLTQLCRRAIKEHLDNHRLVVGYRAEVTEPVANRLQVSMKQPGGGSLMFFEIVVKETH